MLVKMRLEHVSIRTHRITDKSNQININQSFLWFKKKFHDKQNIPQFHIVFS